MSQFDSSLIGQRQQRLQKLDQLIKLGINPYPAVSKQEKHAAEIEAKFNELEGQKTTVAGRVMGKREHGQLAFLDLQDASGKIQIYIKAEDLKPFSKEDQTLGWDELNLIDVGDFIQVTGEITKTQRGEISILAKELTLLTKTLRPLPDKWHGVQDIEERFRRRYVDMTMSPEVRARFERRAKFWQAHRDFFNSKGFVEINVPVLEHIPGGGDATPFTTHMDAIDEDFYLRISHELPLKRLIGGGFEKVYDIGPRFRNEGLSDEHLPEHVAMEFYWAYADWKDGMKLIQELYQYVLKQVYGGKQKFKVREFEIDLEKDWDIVDFNDVMKERYGIKDIYTVTYEELLPSMEKEGIDPKAANNIPRAVDALWKKIRKTIGGPAFLINHPKYLSPLQKPSLSNPLMVERFQPIIAGSELGNGWSEVNDAVDQYQRFVEQQRLRDAGDAEAQWLDIDYVEMLEYGMPPTFGYGHSERVFWFLEDVTAREGVPFPQLKSALDKHTLEIYSDARDILENQFGHKQQKSKPTTQRSNDQTIAADDKIVLVINADVSGWQFANTVGHLSTYLGAKVGEAQLLHVDSFKTEDGEVPANAHLPIIIKKADSNAQLQSLMAEIEKAGLPHLGFIQEMLDFHTDAEVQTAVSGKAKSDLSYLGIGLYGPKEQVDPITKKFSLWK